MEVGAVTRCAVDVSGNRRQEQAVYETVSRLFGMGAEHLRDALDRGQTLSDIAAAKGISAAELYKAIRLAMLLASRVTEHGLRTDCERRVAHAVAQHVGTAARLDVRV